MAVDVVVIDQTWRVLKEKVREREKEVIKKSKEKKEECMCVYNHTGDNFSFPLLVVADAIAKHVSSSPLVYPSSSTTSTPLPLLSLID